MGQAAPPSSKSFARPFQLVFETRDDKTTLIEVKTLRGLKEVMRRLTEGEIFVRGGFSLELQLWGHLAEHCGFLRSKTTSDGVQPLGEGHAELTEDLSEIFGGEKGVLEALNATKDLLDRQGSKTGGVENADGGESVHLKDDGVNLTPAGEQKLAEIIGERGGKLQQAQDDGVQIYIGTPPEPELDVDTTIKVESEEFEGKTVSGPEAEEIGKRVEEAGEGKPLNDSSSGSSQEDEES